MFFTLSFPCKGTFVFLFNFLFDYILGQWAQVLKQMLWLKFVNLTIETSFDGVNSLMRVLLNLV